MSYVDPDSVVSNNWTVSAGTANTATDDAVRDPTNARTGGDGAYVSTSTAGNICDLGFATVSLGSGQSGMQVVAKAYASGGTKRSITIDLRYTRASDSTDQSLGTATVAAGSAASWRTITASGLSLVQSEIDSLHLRMTCNSTGGSSATAVQVDAAYLDITLKTAYTDSATIPSVTDPSGSSEVTAKWYDDSAEIDSVTTPTGVDILSHHYFDPIVYDNYLISTTYFQWGNSTVERIAQTYLCTADEELLSLTVRLLTQGSPTDDVVAYVCNDNGSNAPDENNILATSDVVDVQTSQNYIFIFESPPSLINGTKYWLVIKRTGALDQSNFYAEYTNNNAYPSGDEFTYGSGAWTIRSGKDWHFGVTLLPGGDYSIPVGKTTPSGTDEYTPAGSGTEYTDNAEIDGTSSPSTVEIYEAVDSSTINGATTPIVTEEISEFVDSATISSTTTLSQVELHELIDSATIASNTTPIVTAEIAAYIEPTVDDWSGIVDSNVVFGAVAAQWKVAIKFVPQSYDSIIRQVGFFLSKTGSPVDQVQVDLCADSSGVPGSVLASSTNAVTPTASLLEYQFNIPYTLTPGVSYWFVLRRTGSLDNSNRYNTYSAPSSYYQYKFFSYYNTVWTQSGNNEPLGFKVYFNNRITSVTAISVTEVSDLIDSETVTSLSTPSTTELIDYSDSQTINNITTPNSDEIYTPLGGTEYDDGDTTSSITTPSSFELHELFDADTISGITDTSSVEQAAFIEAFTVAMATTPSGEETHEIPDSSTIASTTTITVAEEAGYVDAFTTTSSSTISGEEYSTYTDSQSVAGISGISAEEISVYIEGLVITSISDITGSDLVGYVDLGDIPSTTVITYSELTEFVDVNTTSGITTPSSDEIYIPYGGTIYPDSATVANTTTIQSDELREITDAAIISDSTTPSAEEYAAYIDANTASSATVPGVSEAAAFVDAATSSSSSFITSDEFADYSDSNTTASGTLITSQEVTTYVEANTTQSATSLSSEEIHEISDSGTINNVTAISAVEVLAVVDADAVSMATAISSTELAGYVDSFTVSNTTEISSVDVHLTGKQDADTIPTATTPSMSDIAAFVDVDTIVGINSLESIEGNIHVYDDADSISTSTSFQYTEYSTYTDDNAISCSNNLYSAEIFSPSDSGSVNSISYISSTDLALYLDSAELDTTTSLSGTDEHAFHYTDTTTTDSFTSITYEEYAEYTDAGTLRSSTIPSGIEETTYTDYGLAKGITYLTAEEIFKTPQEDVATLTSYTTITAVEFAHVLQLLIAVYCYPRWIFEGSQTRWPVEGLVKRWDGADFGKNYPTTSLRKWLAWTN